MEGTLVSKKEGNLLLKDTVETTGREGRLSEGPAEIGSVCPGFWGSRRRVAPRVIGSSRLLGRYRRGKSREVVRLIQF